MANSSDDVVEVDPLGIKSSDLSLVLLIYPHSPSVCSMSRTDGLIMIDGIKSFLIRNSIIVPMGSVTYYEIKKTQYLEGNSTKQKHVASSNPLNNLFHMTILKENRSEFIEA